MAESPKSPPPSGQSGVFQISEALRKVGGPVVAEAPRPAPAELSTQDLNEIRLLLRGDSVVDWHRLDLRTEEQVHRLFALNSIDLSHDADRSRVAALRARAVGYIRDTLRLRVDAHIAQDIDIAQVLLLASGEGREQRQACLLLKVMHIIYHLDARELRTRLAISDNDLFSLVEASVVAMFDELRGAGVPVVEFSWSRKTLGSLITKMLVKRQTSAARVFDRLRFRLIVEDPSDLIPTVHVMLHRCIPFNYVVPSHTVNTLIDLADVERIAEQRGIEENERSFDPPPSNEFSSQEFAILNFIADLPVRVDSLLWDQDGRHEDHGQVVFVLAEFQVMDRVTAEKNESGESAHASYKNRQHARVKQRLLRAPHERHDDGDAK